MTLYTHQLLDLAITPCSQRIYGRDAALASQCLLWAAKLATEFGSTSQSDLYSVFGLSSDQHHQAWDQQLAQDPDLASWVRGLASQHAFFENPEVELEVNIRYAAAIACIVYRPLISLCDVYTSFNDFQTLWLSQGHDCSFTDWELLSIGSAIH